MATTHESDPFQEGVKARDQGLNRSDNPYPIGSKERVDWNEGFCASCDLDEEDDPASNRISDRFD